MENVNQFRKEELDVRTQKCDNLPEGSEHRKDKYNAAMTHTLMSKDKEGVMTHSCTPTKFTCSWRVII